MSIIKTLGGEALGCLVLGALKGLVGDVFDPKVFLWSSLSDM